MLLYSFDTKRNRRLLNDLDHDVFYFKKLNQDFNVFQNMILSQNPKWILGIAAFKETQFESKAINQFNKSKLISKSSQFSFDLFIPKSNLKVNKSTSDSFCNWSSYRICEFVKLQNLDIKVSFLHCEIRDFISIRNILGKKWIWRRRGSETSPSKYFYYNPDPLIPSPIFMIF